MRHSDGCAVASRLHNFSDWRVKAAHGGGHANHKRKTCRAAWSFTCQGLDALVMQLHQDLEACWYNAQGQYVGPWVLHGNAWMALFSPVHLWPVAYVPAGWTSETDAAKPGPEAPKPETDAAAKSSPAKPEPD